MIINLVKRKLVTLHKVVNSILRNFQQKNTENV